MKSFFILISLFSTLVAAADFDSRVAARELISKIETQDLNRPLDPNVPTYDFYNDSKIILAFQMKYFPLIKKNGFLNQFQVNHSINMDRKNRQKVEDELSGTKLKRYKSLKDPYNYLRPKYAYLTLDKESGYKATGGIHINSNYGQIYAKFKDEVKDRSTFTGGDSLYMIGAKKGSARSFRATQSDTTDVYQYWEAQVWGELTLDDVDYVLVNCKSSTGFIEKVSPEEIQEIKDAGVRVFECISVFQNPIYSFARYRLDQGKEL